MEDVWLRLSEACALMTKPKIRKYVKAKAIRVRPLPCLFGNSNKYFLYNESDILGILAEWEERKKIPPPKWVKGNQSDEQKSTT